MTLIRGNALSIPLADRSVDLIVTSPPYFALRSYTDACGTCGGIAGGGRPVGGPSQLEGRTQRATDPGAVTVEPDPDCPECQGSGRGHYAGQIGSEPTPAAFIDALVSVTRECVRVLKPSGSLFVNLGDKYVGGGQGGNVGGNLESAHENKVNGTAARKTNGLKAKSLMGLPWRYALRSIDDLGLILRAEIIWSKPNGLPESVQDRVRRSHEQWFHFTLEPRYYAAVDEIREPHAEKTLTHRGGGQSWGYEDCPDNNWGDAKVRRPDPLGKLPGSVWTVATEPLRVPDHLPQHFAAFPSEWPRRIILGWCPEGGRVLDPFVGTGTVPAVANALGRYGVGIDLSADYLRLARWRCQDPGLRAKVLGVDKPAPEVPGQTAMAFGV